MRHCNWATYIGTEHLLLGLIKEGEGVAAQVLTKLGADSNKVRAQVQQMLQGFDNKESATVGGEQIPQRVLRFSISLVRT